MPCQMEPPIVTEKEWLEHMLCQACRFLTREQLQKIDGLDCYQGLWGWYQSHLLEDAYHYSRQKETHHATFKDSILSFSSLDYAKEQLQRCEKEAERMGLTIIIKENSIELSNAKKF